MLNFRHLAIAATLVCAFSQQSVAQISYPPSDAAARAEAAQAKADAAAAKAAADAAATAAAATVKTVNNTAPVSGNVTVPIPTAGTVAPPPVADAGAAGTASMQYSPVNHTHASKARKGRALIPVVSGNVVGDVTFSTPFTTGIPVCNVTAEASLGDATVVNAQMDGQPTMTGMRIRITRTAIATVLGIPVLSLPTQVATYAHYTCLEP